MTDVLLIDQDSLFQKAFSKMLGSNDNCRLVGIAENSVDALELITVHRPQIIFCDVMLGVENGLSLCRTIKNRFPDIILYILSNYCNFSLLKNAMSAGVEEYLNKPISRTRLFSLIRSTSKIAEVGEENPFYDQLYASFEEKNYKRSYELADSITEWMFKECDKQERKNQMVHIQNSLFHFVPGLDRLQMEYFAKKYEINSRILSKKFLCYHWLVEIITEVYSQVCTMRYTHMNKVFRYIENNKHNEISLADLSAQAGISSGYLSRIFKKYYKISVVDYIHLRKLLKAKHYMVMSEMNISDISFLMGYSEAGYFCKIFKKYEGETPSSFNRKVK